METIREVNDAIQERAEALLREPLSEAVNRPLQEDISDTIAYVAQRPSQAMVDSTWQAAELSQEEFERIRDGETVRRQPFNAVERVRQIMVDSPEYRERMRRIEEAQRILGHERLLVGGESNSPSPGVTPIEAPDLSDMVESLHHTVRSVPDRTDLGNEGLISQSQILLDNPLHTTEGLEVLVDNLTRRRSSERPGLISQVLLSRFEGNEFTAVRIAWRAELYRLIDERLQSDSLESHPEEVKPKKPEFDKARFLNSIPMTSELVGILSSLDTKEAILKAVFDYNQKPQKPVKYKVNRKALAFVEEYNRKIEVGYRLELEKFYEETMDAFNSGNVGSYVADREGTIRKYPSLPTDIFTHPLFRIVSVKKVDIRGFRNAVGITFETREDVKFTYMDKRINAGTYRFRLLLGRENRQHYKIKFNQKACNFRNHAGPYLSQNHLCTGDSGLSLRDKIRAGNLYDYMTELYTVMTHYNPDSHPYRALDRLISEAEGGSLRRRDGSVVHVEYLTEAVKPQPITNEEIPF